MPETPQTIANTEAIKDLIGGLASLVKEVGIVSKDVAIISKDVEIISRDGKRTYDTITKISDLIQEIAPVTKMLNTTNQRVKNLEDENKLGVRPVTLKNLSIAAIGVVATFGIWATIHIYDLRIKLSTHEAKQILTEKECEEDIIYNKNQITWLKGAKLDKPRK